MYHMGVGVTKNLVTAERYYKMAADQGDETGKTNLELLKYK